ncbi:MAG: hypothetical protein EOO42_03760 [Flavobacteriales bacterium]|nr:MAG: hypothetical protein EOO42_03760 [Flavobacteriales bacterium]
MLNKFKNTLIIAMALFVATGMSACKKSKDETGTDTKEKKYGVLMMVGSWPNTAYYITSLASIKEGTIDLKGKGVNISNIVQDQGLIQRNGNYYYYNAANSRFGKYHIENDLLVTDKEVQFTSMADISSHFWADNNTLVVFGANGDQDKIQYAVINATTLTITSGTLTLPATPDAAYKTILPGFVEYRDGKIFLGYSFLTTWPTPAYKKIFVAVINYPTMAVAKVLEDTKSSSPGGPTRYTPYSFIDENNDIYFTTVPDTGWDFEAPSYVYRIKNGTDVLDATYSFNFSSKSNGHTIQAMWYLGNGQAIARVRIPSDRSKPDFYYNWDSYFSVINVKTGEVVRKLDLGTDIGQIYVQSVVVEDGKAYIMFNGANAAGAIWEYDPVTAKLTKGAGFGAGYDLLLRLDKWK